MPHTDTSPLHASVRKNNHNWNHFGRITSLVMFFRWLFVWSFRLIHAHSFHLFSCFSSLLHFLSFSFTLFHFFLLLLFFLFFPWFFPPLFSFILPPVLPMLTIRPHLSLSFDHRFPKRGNSCRTNVDPFFSHATQYDEPIDRTQSLADTRKKC